MGPFLIWHGNIPFWARCKFVEIRMTPQHLVASKWAKSAPWPRWLCSMQPAKLLHFRSIEKGSFDLDIMAIWQRMEVFFLLCRHHIILDFWCYVLKCLLDLWHHFSFPRFAPSRFCRGRYLLFEISWRCLPEVQERSWKSRDSHRVQRAAWPMPWSWEARHTQQGGGATQRLRLCEDRWLGRVFVCNLKSIF